MHKRTILLRNLGVQPYAVVCDAMRAFTQQRGPQTQDELWLLQHPPVLTLGLNGRRAHILRSTDIPIIQSDRGGQVTYHGPGQLVLYPLLDLARNNLGVRALVTALEQSCVAWLAGYGIDAHAKKQAPGVYIQAAKIASVGLRIKRLCSYHGLSVNIAMDLSPFRLINPCGYADLVMTQLADWAPHVPFEQAQQDLLEILLGRLRFTATVHTTEMRIAG